MGAEPKSGPSLIFCEELSYPQRIGNTKLKLICFKIGTETAKIKNISNKGPS